MGCGAVNVLVHYAQDYHSHMRHLVVKVGTLVPPALWLSFKQQTDSQSESICVVLIILVSNSSHLFYVSMLFHL